MPIVLGQEISLVHYKAYNIRAIAVYDVFCPCGNSAKCEDDPCEDNYWYYDV